MDVHLVRGADRAAEVDALASGEVTRVGLAGVLGDLNRRATAVRVPAPAASHGFRWDDVDSASQRWWPQGISTSADAGWSDDGLVDGRAVLVTSAYSKTLRGLNLGSRLSFVDLTDPRDIRYRHVLLVEPVLGADGRVDVRPVELHAGGIVWHGDHLHVAGTRRGFSSFRLDDIVRVPSRAEGFFGYRYAWPVRFGYEARATGAERMRYSFASVDRSVVPHQLVAGEYGRDGASTRLVRYEIDPATSLLRSDPAGACHPVGLHDGGVDGMQGATVVSGTWYVTASRGRFRLGSVYVGRPGALREHRWELPVGPEDVTYWPQRDELWSLSEYPGARYVFGVPRSRFGS